MLLDEFSLSLDATVMMRAESWCGRKAGLTYEERARRQAEAYDEMRARLDKARGSGGERV